MSGAPSILTVNAGSSSLKLRLLGPDDEVAASRDGVPGDDPDALREELRAVLAEGPAPAAAAHRVVHGGAELTGAAVVDAGVEAELERLAELAPLHNPQAVRAVRAVAEVAPGLVNIACFDTAFHADLPAAARTYALPADWSGDGTPLRRYGFHGLSHAYASRRAAELLGREVEELRLVTAHLGAGASLAAVAGGRSVDTTMGFTPLEGLIMATRSGSVDPGLVVWLQQHEGLDPDTIAQALEHESGLLGLAGTADLREILERDDEDAVLALDAYVHRLCAGVAAMTAALGGLDALVFTGGVGEHAPEIRRRAAEALAFLGVAIDPTKNADAASDLEITAPGAAVATHVVAAREDREIARQVRAVLG